MARQTSFIVTRLAREDLDERLSKEEIAKLTDEDMRYIARKMGEAYCESGAFWDHAEIYARMILSEKQQAT